MKSFREVTLDLLMKIEKDHGFSHLLINQAIQREKLNEKDEALLTQIVYGTIEHKMTLDYYLSSFIKQNKKLDPWIRMLLRMSVYQMVYLTKVPDHAIIHEAVEIAKKKGHRGIQGFVNGVLRNIQRKGVPPISEISDPVERLSIETSHPKWLINNWIEQYGFETTKAICEANVGKQATSVRIQPLRISRDEAIMRLESEGFEVKASKFSDQGIIINKGNILKSDLFKEGLLSIQDQSSMLVAEVMQAKPEMEVLDACSAPGGKATHIAEKMENKGKVFAHDLHKKKIKLIEDKQESLQLSIIEGSAQDARKLQEIYEPGTFDRILIDAPCSGLGVIRSKPEIKYEKTKEDINRLQTIQVAILNHVAPLLKDDGRLVYSTCTIEKNENEQVIEHFLEMNSEYEVDEEFFKDLPEFLQSSSGITAFGLQLFPHEFDTDGFFLTRLKKVR
jgi:16S rRNA (cytosine967-C5)-methyltransferase